MEKALITSILLLSHMLVFGQEKLIKDLDHDGIKDTVYLSRKELTIVCQLSSQKFAKIQSQPIGNLSDNSGINATKNGFEFFNDWMRAGFKTQFRYNKNTKKVQMIGIGRYSFGGATHDGSGESSVNLLTHDYLGDWNYFNTSANNGEGRLVKIPTIRAKMKFKAINLETYSESIYSDYEDKCTKLYEKHQNGRSL
ncbi:hypothetical protein [Pedobacter steynii]|uniref:Uncharacterized protein n=1 Tax=Pedobacter steynii TaxID=430522 RepID=A0A1D7QNM9_9SPHI|nr:hypothetical protein [Pedobacter steynii]AOM80290.1 hypothetical protein BFS30_25880 [Pedobacter steynii]